MPPRMRSPTAAPVAARPTHALVSAVLAVIDRIGEMVAAIEAGEEFPAGDDQSLIAGARARRRSRRSPPATAADASLKPASAAPRTIRLSVELLDRVMCGRQRHGAGAQRACPPPARIERRRDRRRRVRAPVGDHRRNARRDHPHAHAADRKSVRRPAAHGPRPVGRTRQAGAGRYRGRRRRARSRNDRDDPRSADPHHPQRGRSRHRNAGRPAARPASARSACCRSRRASRATRS